MKMKTSKKKKRKLIKSSAILSKIKKNTLIRYFLSIYLSQVEELNKEV